MNKLLLTFSFLISLIYFTSQSLALPPCPTDTNTNRGNCFGTNTFANGNKYVGEYKGYKRHGQGTFIFTTGAKDEGEFQNGKLNGYAIRYHVNGSTDKQGFWKNDKFLSANKPISISNSKLDEYKSFCSEIGFTPGTEKFGECVVEAMKKG